MEDEYLIQLHVSGNVTLGNRSTLKLVILMENFNEGMQALSSFSSFWKASLCYDVQLICTYHLSAVLKIIMRVGHTFVRT